MDVISMEIKSKRLQECRMLLTVQKKYYASFFKFRHLFFFWKYGRYFSSAWYRITTNNNCKSITFCEIIYRFNFRRRNPESFVELHFLWWTIVYLKTDAAQLRTTCSVLSVAWKMLYHTTPVYPCRVPPFFVSLCIDNAMA